MPDTDPIRPIASGATGRERLAAALLELGWSFEFPEGPEDDVCVARPDESGPNVVLLSPGSDFEELSSLMIRSAWRRDDVTLAMVNTFNYRYRFARAYLDTDGDPVLQMDVMLDGADDPALGRALRRFYSIVLTFEGFVAAFQGLVGQESPPLN